MRTLEELLALAAAALDPRAEGDLERIVEYCDAFGEWHSHNAAAIEQGKFSPVLIDELQQKHTAVIERAGTLKNATSEDLRDLKKRGKGILAYTDTLPKRISTRRERKG